MFTHEISSWPLTPILTNRFKSDFTKSTEVITKLKEYKVISSKHYIPTIVLVADRNHDKGMVIGGLLGLLLQSNIQSPIVIKFEQSETVSTIVRTHFVTTGFVEKEVKYTEKLDLNKKLLELNEIIVPADRFGSPLTVVLKRPDIDHLKFVIMPSLANETENLDQIEGFISQLQCEHDCVFLNVVPNETDLLSFNSTRLVGSLDSTHQSTFSVFTKSVENPDLIEKFVSKKKMHPKQTYIVSDSDPTAYDSLSQAIIQCFMSKFFGETSLISEKVKDEVAFYNSHLSFETIGHSLKTVEDIFESVGNSLKKLCVLKENDEYPEMDNMNANSKLVHDIKFFRISLLKNILGARGSFLIKELEIVGKTPLLGLTGPKRFSSNLVRTMLKNNLADLNEIIENFINRVFGYLLWVIDEIIGDKSKNLDYLQGFLHMVSSGVIKKFKADFTKKVSQLIEFETNAVYCSDPAYESFYNLLREKCKLPKNVVLSKSIGVDKLGTVTVDHLSGYEKDALKCAMDLKVMMMGYWPFLITRFVDNFALNLIVYVDNICSTGLKEQAILYVGENHHDDDEVPKSADKKTIKTRAQILEEILGWVNDRQREFNAKV